MIERKGMVDIMAERNLNFDKIIDRRNTRCLKYDFAVEAEHAGRCVTVFG